MYIMFWNGAEQDYYKDNTAQGGAEGMFGKVMFMFIICSEN